MNLREEGCWDRHYEDELRNFEDNGDCGDVWFGKPLTRRIVDWILTDIKASYSKESPASIDIIDVGCGNAYLLSTLIKRSKDSLDDSMLNRLRLHGIDYSENAVRLSRKIIEAEDNSVPINLQQCDFLDLPQVCQLNQSSKFDYIVDKGTFDAICLIGDGKGASEQAKEIYGQSLCSIIKKGTKLIISSCNHTEEELLSIFEVKSTGAKRIMYDLVDRIETPKIKFGGVEGSQVRCLILSFD